VSSWGKREYLLRLVGTGTNDKRMVTAALLYYHSGVPLEDAMEYIGNLKKKLEK